MSAWQFSIGRVTVALHIEPVDGYEYDGDDENGETQAALDSGEYVAFDSMVTVSINGHVVGSDSLCGSVYAADDIAEFWQAHRTSEPEYRNTLANAARKRCICHYFPDMVRQAIADARATLGQRDAA